MVNQRWVRGVYAAGCFTWQGGMLATVARGFRRTLAYGGLRKFFVIGYTAYTIFWLA